MLWFYAVVTAALGFAATLLISKSIMQESSSFDFAAIYSFLSPLFLLPIFLYYFPRLEIAFEPLSISALLISGLANTAAIIVSSKAVKEGEVSTVTPLIRTQPLFAAIIGIIILGELATLQKGLGILLTTAGGYIVLLKKEKKLSEPITQLRNSLPAQLGVLAGFLYAVGAVADRFATQSIPPKIYTFLLLAFMGTSFLIYIITKKREKIPKLKQNFNNQRLSYLVVGLVTAIAYYALVTALSLAEASKVIPVLQIQVLIVVAGGYLIFSEKAFKRKIIGSLILISGVVLIAGPKLAFLKPF